MAASDKQPSSMRRRESDERTQAKELGHAAADEGN